MSLKSEEGNVSRNAIKFTFHSTIEPFIHRTSSSTITMAHNHWKLSAFKRWIKSIQSRPIEMRATILYLANRWTEFEMLLTPLRFLYLVMFSLLAFPSIPQFIAHFWQIGSFLCIVLPFSNSYRNESCSKACSAHFANAATLFFSLLLKEQNGGAKKVLNFLNQRDWGYLEL